MYLHRLLYSKYSCLLISIILGFGLATMFRKECKQGPCLEFRGAPIKKTKNKIFLHNNSCHTFSANSESCNPEKRQVSFA